MSNFYLWIAICDCMNWSYLLRKWSFMISRPMLRIECSMIWIAHAPASASCTAGAIHERSSIHGEANSCPRGQFIAVAISLFRSFFNCNSDRNRHTNHGVVAGADEAHHLYAIRALAELRGESLGLQALRCKPFEDNALQNHITLNTSFSVLLIALYRVFNVL